ncbi:YgaP family membrane protein [Rubricoccus marinus]|uniref:Inner membrane protein YgaP-like transmembrane domain-containing protein n=1 Tax=Rubricoccus marinus TaxID=716817 RepID=A0A259TWW5_9BACT|nr:DUF2892 domain-containing protein [Rubricoccus marinus]OZC02259.1 hypothetical protein BSZ36_04205 [Rubricoccus marinus]
MTTNLSYPDRKVRLVAAGVIGVLLLFGLIESTLFAWVLGVIAVVLVATAAVGFCPLYRSVGLSTLPRRRS